MSHRARLSFLVAALGAGLVVWLVVRESQPQLPVKRDNGDSSSPAPDMRPSLSAPAQTATLSTGSTSQRPRDASPKPSPNRTSPPTGASPSIAPDTWYAEITRRFPDGMPPVVDSSLYPPPLHSRAKPEDVPPLQLRASLTRTTFVRGMPIVLTLEPGATPTGTRLDVYPTDAAAMIREATDPPMPWQTVLHEEEGTDSYSIPASLGGWNVSIHAGWAWGKNGRTVEYPFWKHSGRYQAKGYLDVHILPDKGNVRIESNVVEFEVVDPPPRDRGAFDALVQEDIFAGEGEQKRRDKLAAFIERFPDSIYTPYAILDRCECTQVFFPEIQDDDQLEQARQRAWQERLKLLRRIPTEFPSFAEGDRVLYLLGDADRDTEEGLARGRQWWQRLAQQYPDSPWTAKARERQMDPAWTPPFPTGPSPSKKRETPEHARERMSVEIRDLEHRLEEVRQMEQRKGQDMSELKQRIEERLAALRAALR